MSQATRILLDTTVVIDTLRNRNQRRQLLSALAASGQSFAISTITIAEVYGGIRSGEGQPTRALLVNLEWIPVSPEIAERAGFLKSKLRSQGQTRSITDILVAATALELGLTVATDNRRDFQIAGLELYPLP